MSAAPKPSAPAPAVTASSRAAQSAAPPTASAAPTSSGASGKLPPLQSKGWLVELELEGFGGALVSVPRGITTPRPVVVALHGYRDRPEWQCGAWTGIVRARAFVLCPQGTKVPTPGGNYTFGTVDAVKQEIVAGLEALRERYGEYVHEERVALVGFSLGAHRAAYLAAADPKLFRRVALIEGGTDEWNRAQQLRFAEGGGERVALVCTRMGCEPTIERLAATSQRGQTQARPYFLGHFGHTFGPKVTSRMRAPWAWLAAGWL